MAALCAVAQDNSSPNDTHDGAFRGDASKTVIDPTQSAGSDIGAQINAAFAACSGNSIHLRIPPGKYVFSTPVVFSGACIPQIDAEGVEMDYRGSGQAITFSGLNVGGAFAGPRLLRGLHLVYTGRAFRSAVGIAVGDTAGKACCGVGVRLENAWIDNFGIDLLFGANAWNFSAIGDYFSADRAGKILVSFPAEAANSGESLHFTNSTFFSTRDFLPGGISIRNGSTSSSWDGDNFDNVEVALLAGNNNMSSPYWENPDAPIPAGHFFLITGATGALLNPYFAANRGWVDAGQHFMASIAGNWSADGSQAVGTPASPCTAFYHVATGARFTLTGTRNGCDPFVAANGANVTAILSETGDAATFAGVAARVHLLANADDSGNETTPGLVLQNGRAPAQFSVGTLKAGSSSADGDGRISTWNGSALQDHMVFHNGNAPFHAPETEIMTPSVFDNEVGFQRGIDNSASGLKHVRVSSTCVTAASLGATCTFKLPLPGTAFPDLDFTSTCTAVGATTGVPVLTVHTVAVSQLTLQIQAASSAAATVSGVDCIAVHD
jgi:hypothetical protein